MIKTQWKAGSVLLFLYCLISQILFAQQPVANYTSTPVTLTVDAAVKYAMQHQTRIQQSLTDEQIAASSIRSRLADWYPQLNFNYNLQHNFILPTSIIGGNPIRFGVENTSAGQFTLSQTLFNRDVLLARRTRNDVLQQAQQTTQSAKIDLAANVAKAFYDVLATGQQIRIADENVLRIERSLQDATAQYKAGTADKIDYKRATITLNNIKASRLASIEQVKAKTAYLKYLIGYPDSVALNIAYDSATLEKGIVLDTLQQPDFHNRIEYQLLETQRRLLQSNLLYNKWSFLPSATLNGAYYLNYQNNQLTKLYGNNFPNSFAAVTIAVPLFQGGKRKANIRTASLQLQRTDQDLVNVSQLISSQYAQALASYKSGYATYLSLRENVALAREVYDVIQLQYRSGIKTYLEVITAETDLRTSQINYYNALYQVLSGKIDVQRALGILTF